MKSKWAATMLLAVLVTGCASSPRSAPQPSPGSRPGAQGRPAPAGAHPSALPATATRVVETARALLDTPYRYSGSDPKGFDCSGLTSFVFRAVGVELPRTAAAQAGIGTWVPADELAPGDLVFFGETRGKPFHVGLVTSRPGEPLTMIHSSSSSGVIETEILSDSYWLPRLRFGRRALEPDR